MKIKCNVCGRVKDEPKGFNGNSIDHSASYHLLLVKIHEKIESLDNMMINDFMVANRQNVFGQIQILKSLLDNEKL